MHCQMLRELPKQAYCWGTFKRSFYDFVTFIWLMFLFFSGTVLKKNWRLHIAVPFCPKNFCRIEFWSLPLKKVSVQQQQCSSSVPLHYTQNTDTFEIQYCILFCSIGRAERNCICDRICFFIVSQQQLRIYFNLLLACRFYKRSFSSRNITVTSLTSAFHKSCGRGNEREKKNSRPTIFPYFMVGAS